MISASKIRLLWNENRVFLIEAFAWFNLAFLSLDILYAHSMNEFGHWAEWIPFAFSILAGIILLPSVIQTFKTKRLEQGYHYWAGFVIGWLGVGVGFAGLVYHLQSSFFQELTLQTLVYAAPFAAPLAYAGLGLLLLLNRNLSAQSEEWGRWIVFLALGGFIGNFALALTDHAINGFFYTAEWIPVVTAAFAVAFLLVIVVNNPDQKYYHLCFGVLAVQVLVGMLGFYYHFVGNLHGAGEDIVSDFIHGAPVFAPLLFPNLAILAAFGIWDLLIKNHH